MEHETPAVVADLLAMLAVALAIWGFLAYSEWRQRKRREAERARVAWLKRIESESEKNRGV